MPAPSVMRPRSLICDWITGALVIFSSSTMAMRRPMFSPVSLPMRSPPLRFMVKSTSGVPISE